MKLDLIHVLKLASRLQVGKLIFISGFFDLNDNETPFIEAKEIDILDEFSDRQNNKNKKKRKIELADLSIQRLEKAAKNTKVKTRSQRKNEKQPIKKVIKFQ